VAAIFTGSCGSPTELACAQSKPLHYSLTAGTTYRILVGDYYNVIAGPPLGTIGATIRVPPPPPTNDQCSGATVVSTVPFTDAGVDYTTTASDIDVSCNDAADLETGAGVWYAYTAATDHLLGIDYRSQGEDGVAAVFTGTCGNLTEVACGTDRRLNHPVEAGETYYILLGGRYATDPPTFADIDVVEAPPNDDCGDAKVIPTASFAESLDTSTASYAYSDPDPGCGVFEAEASVWYTFMTTESGAVTVSTCGSDYDTVVSAYTGSCTDVSAQMVTCNDDDGFSCLGAQGSMLFGATAGVQYWIQVAEPEADTKATKALAVGGQLEFSFESTVPVTDPRLVFSDGFESGQTDEWSTTIP